MVTGFNTDVEHRGVVFHVQTEEKGPSNPVMVTLVYCQGEVIASYEASYSSQSGTNALSDEQIRTRMRRQHRGLIEAIRGGKYDPSTRYPGEDRRASPSLDELVLGYLENEIDRARVVASGRNERQVAELRGAPDPVKVRRLLGRLERFLDAARRAEATAARVEPPTPLPAVTTTYRRPPPPRVAVVRPPVIETVVPVRGEPGGRHRTPRSTWIVTAAVLACGLASLFFFGRPPAMPARPTFVAAPFAPPPSRPLPEPARPVLDPRPGPESLPATGETRVEEVEALRPAERSRPDPGGSETVPPASGLAEPHRPRPAPASEPPAVAVERPAPTPIDPREPILPPVDAEQ
ncbi:MAG TPA: hypothetical protein VD788_08605, partial [Candidatus Polarisedimenticolaceae bacterium]|nr:hypothetical protein [Candidatus Polarisedimenticolaceae bacterium]